MFPHRLCACAFLRPSCHADDCHRHQSRYGCRRSLAVTNHEDHGDHGARSQRNTLRCLRASVARPLRSPASRWRLTGFAAMGMEILWFRHFSILLGEFRAVFSLLLAIILLGIGTGSLAGGYVQRRTSRPAQILMVAQGSFAAATLLGLAMADARPISDASLSYADPSRGCERLRRQPGIRRAVVQRETDSARRWYAGGADGIRVPARQRDHPASGGIGRTPRRHALPGQHVRRGVRIAGDRIPAVADARDSAERDGADGRRGVGHCAASPCQPPRPEEPAARRDRGRFDRIARGLRRAHRSRLLSAAARSTSSRARCCFRCGAPTRSAKGSPS